MTHRRALFSVYDKAGLAELASGLSGQGFELIASGETARELETVGLPVTDIASLTGSSGLSGGRSEALHPAIRAGLLSHRAGGDLAALGGSGSAPLDLVVCNLSPLDGSEARAELREADMIERIDLGGLTLLRAAAENHARVTVVPHPSFYDEVLGALVLGDGMVELNRRMARESLKLTERYEREVLAWLGGDERLLLGYERLLKR